MAGNGKEGQGRWMATMKSISTSNLPSIERAETFICGASRSEDHLAQVCHRCQIMGSSNRAKGNVAGADGDTYAVHCLACRGYRKTAGLDQVVSKPATAVGG